MTPSQEHLLWNAGGTRDERFLYHHHVGSAPAYATKTGRDRSKGKPLCLRVVGYVSVTNQTKEKAALTDMNNGVRRDEGIYNLC